MKRAADHPACYSRVFTSQQQSILMEVTLAEAPNALETGLACK